MLLFINFLFIYVLLGCTCLTLAQALCLVSSIEMSVCGWVISSSTTLPPALYCPADTKSYIRPSSNTTLSFFMSNQICRLAANKSTVWQYTDYGYLSPNISFAASVSILWNSQVSSTTGWILRAYLHNNNNISTSPHLLPPSVPQLHRDGEGRVGDPEGPVRGASACHVEDAGETVPEIVSLRNVLIQRLWWPLFLVPRKLLIHGMCQNIY